MKKGRTVLPGKKWLQIDGFRKDPIAMELFFAARRLRPSILAPWHGECLTLRAGDRRISARELWKPEDGLLEDWLERVAPGQKFKLPANRRQAVVSAEVVLLDAATLRRVCSWPALPEDCSIDRAAELLGATRNVICRWIKRGILVGRKFSYRRNRPSIAVAYRQHLKLKIVQRELGVFEYPDPAAKRIFSGEPDVAWAVERFEREIQVQNLVRLAEQRSRRGVLFWLPLWVCPGCGSLCRWLYLPAGPMAQAGHLWGRWRFQCGGCTGVKSERRDWISKRNNGFNRNLLKMTCGEVSASEFHREMQRIMSRSMRATNQAKLLREMAKKKKLPRANWEQQVHPHPTLSLKGEG